MSVHQSNILWKGLQNDSLEFCSIHFKAGEIKVESHIVAFFDNDFCFLHYLLLLHEDWTLQFFGLDSRFATDKNTWKLKGSKNDQWIINDKPEPALNECIDIDISLTPFTNTLPINRLNLFNGQDAIITVVYVDVEERRLKVAEQRYTKLENDKYKFETIPNNFEAVVEVNAAGLVTHYPGLFTMLSYNEK